MYTKSPNRRKDEMRLARLPLAVQVIVLRVQLLRLSG